MLAAAVAAFGVAASCIVYKSVEEIATTKPPAGAGGDGDGNAADQLQVLRQILDALKNTSKAGGG